MDDECVIKMKSTDVVLESTEKDKNNKFPEEMKTDFCLFESNNTEDFQVIDLLFDSCKYIINLF